jgi:hypothetical protein
MAFCFLVFSRSITGKKQRNHAQSAHGDERKEDSEYGANDGHFFCQK